MVNLRQIFPGRGSIKCKETDRIRLLEEQSKKDKIAGTESERKWKEKLWQRWPKATCRGFCGQQRLWV